MGLFLYAKYVYKFFPSRSVRKIAAVRFLFSTKTYFEGRSFVQLTCPFSSQPGVQGTGVGVQVQEWEFRYRSGSSGTGVGVQVQEWEFRQFIVCCVVYQMQGLHRDERYQKVASGEYTGIWTGTTQEWKLPILEERWVHRDLDRDYTGANVTNPWGAVSTQGFGYGLHRGESYQSLANGEYTGIWIWTTHGRKLPVLDERWVQMDLDTDYTRAKVTSPWRAVSTQGFGYGIHRGESYQSLTSGEYTGIWTGSTQERTLPVLERRIHSDYEGEVKSHYFKVRSRCCWLQTFENWNSNRQSVLMYKTAKYSKTGLAKMRTSWKNVTAPQSPE